MKRSSAVLAALTLRAGFSARGSLPRAFTPLAARASSLACRHPNTCSTRPVRLLGTTMDSRTFATLPQSEYTFRQLFDSVSSTYTYILADAASREAVIIDPVYEQVQRDIQIIRDLDLNLIYAINTHVHADHVTGTWEIKSILPECKSILSRASGGKADILLENGDKIKFGRYELECRSTPGHTDGCLTYVWHEKGMVFTGDALLIRGCGRTDFQQGDSSTLYDSVHSQIFSLPGATLVYPAHDYTGRMASSVEEEKKHNRRLRGTKEEFIQIMKELKLAYPKQIDRALPLNLVCGFGATPVL